MEGLRPEDPQRVGRYRLLKRLGSGAMGHVYLGQSPSGRLVAVKIIRAELADNANFRQRFRQEVKAARRVSGIFTAPVVDANPDARQPWMVTAFVSGPSLAEAVETRGPMPVRAVLILAAGLVEGLSAVHAAGVVHRDLKPSNVLLASDGPRIIDFGISRSVGSVGPTQARGIIGSPGFMSPEQAMGEPVGPPADIFSLGSVLAYAATGQPPFGDGPPTALLYRAVHGEPAIRNVPSELRPLVARCLLADPGARPTTDELLRELGEAAPTPRWLDWLGAGTAPAARGLNTVPSEAWGDLTGVSGEQLAVDTAPDDEVPHYASADVGPSAVSAHTGEVRDFASSGSGPRQVPRADATGGDAALAPSPARSLSWVFPDSGDPPPRAAARFRRDRTRRQVGMAVAGVLGVAILGAMAIWLVPRLDPNPSAAGSLTAHSRAAGTGRSARRTSSPRGGPSAIPSPRPSGIRGLPAAEVAEAKVVLAYFEAINERSLTAAWPLGGVNLYPNTNALISFYADVSHVAVVIMGVQGNTVLARIRTTDTSGAVVVNIQDFVVSNGAIVAAESAPVA